MKIAAFPKCYLDAISSDGTMTVFDWIEMARELPTEGLEMYEGFFASLDDDYIDRVGQAVRHAGFEMPMLCCSPDFTHPDPDRRRAAVEHERQMMAVTRRLGGRFCRVLTGQRHPEVAVEDGVRWVRESIEQLLPDARRLDVVLALENHYKDGHWRYPEFAQKKEVFLQVLDAIPERTHFGVQFDPSNAIVAGDNPLELLQLVKDRVVTVHASDRYLSPGVTLDQLRQTDGTIGYSPDLQHGVTGQGLNDYDAIFRVLVEINFRGWISIEDGMNGMDEMRQSLEFLHAKRAKYFGGGSSK